MLANQTFRRPSLARGKEPRLLIQLFQPLSKWCELDFATIHSTIHTPGLASGAIQQVQGGWPHHGLRRLLRLLRRASHYMGHAVDGEYPFRTKETMVDTMVSWYLQGNHQKPGCLRWCRVFFLSTVWDPKLFLHLPLLHVL